MKDEIHSMILDAVNDLRKRATTIDTRLDIIERCLQDLDTLNEQREKARVRMAKKRAGVKNVREQQNVREQKEKEKGKETFPPAPPIEKREEQDKRGDDDDTPVRADAHVRTREGGTGLIEPSPQEYRDWCKGAKIADTQWANAQLQRLKDTGFADEYGRLITNWKAYILKAYENRRRTQEKNRPGFGGAYSRLEGDMKTFFDSFWAAYPKRRRCEKDKCAQVFVRILDHSGDPTKMYNRIMDSLAQWCSSNDWRKQGGEYVMMPYRWLYGANWNDIPEKGQATEKKTQVSATANTKLGGNRSW